MDADVATLRNNFLSPPNLLNPVSERNFWDRLAMTTPVKLSYFKKQRSGQLCPILLPLFSSTFHESDKLHDREKKFERRQRRRRSKLGGLEAFSPRKFSIEGLGNAISRAFRRSFSVNKCEEKCASSIFLPISWKGGILYIPWCIASYYVKLSNARDPISRTTVESDVFRLWNLLYHCCVDLCTIFVLPFQIYLLLSQRKYFGGRY